MGSDWLQSTIGELCDAGEIELQTGPFGSQLHAHEYVEQGIPVVPTEAIRDRRIDHSVLPHVPVRKAADLKRHRLQRGDILFARRGVQATGHVGYVREQEDGFLCGTGAIRLRTVSSRVDPDFLSHLLADPASIAWFKFHAIGATMPNLNEGIIRSFPLSIPPMHEQRAIAHILGTLDDKIELNRRMSETLESMARALFQSWFVDFDPVRAKSEGRDPGLAKHMADLFPDSLEDSELGEAPVGWRVAGLEEVATLVTNTVSPAADPQRIWEHYSIPAYDEGRRPARECGKEIKSNKYRVPPTSILVSKLNPQTPRVWCPDVQVEAAAICSTEFMPFVPIEAESRPWLTLRTAPASRRQSRIASPEVPVAASA